MKLFLFGATALLLSIAVSAKRPQVGTDDMLSRLSLKSESSDIDKGYENSVVFSGTDYYFKGMFRRLGTLLFFQDDQIGVYYRRRIYKNFSIEVGYNKWNSKPLYNIFDKASVKEFAIFPNAGSENRGVVLLGGRFRNVDLILSYRYSLSEKSKLNIGAGISYTWGINTVIDSVYTNPDPPYDGIIFTSPVRASYWGFLPTLSYDYLIFKKRLSIGADLRYRKYFGFYLNTFEYGVHLGVNF